jgi:hypothetical protein
VNHRRIDTCRLRALSSAATLLSDAVGKEINGMQVQDPARVDCLTVNGGQIVDTIKNLIHEGNVRKISIKQDGHTIAEFPLTVGVVGAAMAPPVAAIGAIAALVTDCTIEVERIHAEPAAPVP